TGGRADARGVGGPHVLAARLPLPGAGAGVGGPLNDAEGAAGRVLTTPARPPSPAGTPVQDAARALAWNQCVEPRSRGHTDGREGSMPQNVAEKLIHSHLIEGTPEPGEEIGLTIDQTLTQDATGTMVMLELESLGLDRIRTELSVQYVDHNLLQTDEKNPEDHLFLQSAAERYGLWFSKAGNGGSHPVHQARFGRPGAALIGSDSHTCAAGALGMLAIGVGGLEIAMAMAGDPLYVQMPEVWGVELTGDLPDWVSAKDVVLEMLRRHGVSGGVGRIIEYH